MKTAVPKNLVSQKLSDIQYEFSLECILFYKLLSACFFRSYFSSDPFAAMSIAFMMCGTMFPMAVYTGKILLQVRFGGFNVKLF